MEPEIIDFNALLKDVMSGFMEAKFPPWIGFFYHEARKMVMEADLPEFKEGMYGLTKQGVVWEKFVRHHIVNGLPYEVTFHSGAHPAEREGTSSYRPDVLGMALCTSCAR